MRPSSLPMLSQCACWESSGGNEATAAGTLRHDYLAAVLRCEISGNDGVDVEVASGLAAQLSDEDRDAVHWAADYIRVKAPMSLHPLRLEYHVNPLADDFTPIFENGGTLDCACGPVLFDLKSRERDYTAQMAAYALDMFQEGGWPEIEVHLLFTETKRAQVFKLTEESAKAIVEPIVRAVRSPDKKPTPCEYCGWCKNILACGVAVAKQVATGYSDAEKVKSWHPSEMQTGEELGAALWIWRNILKKWGDSLEYHALDAHQKRGLTITGFEPKEKQGKTYVTDVPQAFGLTGIPQGEFLAGCQLRLNTSKKYPDQVGIIDLYKKFHGLPSTAAAKRDLLKKLEPVIKKTKSTTYLKAVKSGDEENEEGEES